MHDVNQQSLADPLAILLQGRYFTLAKVKDQRLKERHHIRSKNVSCAAIRPAVPSVTQGPSGLPTDKELPKSTLEPAPQTKSTHNNTCQRTAAVK